MIKILVTGANGQLGQCIQVLKNAYSNLEFTFCNSDELDITDRERLQLFFDKNEFDYCINCAAYTNVEQAEKTPEKAHFINGEGVKNIAKECKKHNVILFHISTDYVFDGGKGSPYVISDITNPINEYGKSKLKGENYIKEILEEYFIVRTSWLYSEFGHNFYKTILNKAKMGEDLVVIDTETGCPTNANNLAKYILELVNSNNKSFGVKHFTDNKPMTWFGFAEEILKNNQLDKTTKLVRANNYRSFAKRPKNSTLLCN
ncbi:MULTISPECIES: dTDP-4-dehydrorhamnose reductase [unclassified Cellulophaga]|uniref:dTDP-4-dehydrorhamnose reductase n=1 Tax=unclassified Cellulophaga TaxID=2634405 RepID=UPI0026E4082E|nr:MULTISPECIES: dTDP-4-dehydrorhamnose reductase [unclassified Cellulophaga]MDO6489749.1 dTDP-4-dehydrorhamnose reductase [Cellulophaga sp. 2_MG-2023]MDO6495057.1 dTDP-4-dehydrorhamnose reductase [Cellulophaga sp. 3_MG-2023]